MHVPRQITASLLMLHWPPIGVEHMRSQSQGNEARQVRNKIPGSDYGRSKQKVASASEIHVKAAKTPSIATVPPDTQKTMINFQIL
jgi:hypothetical protein